MDNNILVLAGSKWQIPIINKIKDMGYKSVDINPYENSPAFIYSDYHEIGDILDKDNCLKIAEKYKVKGVISEQCDIATPSIAYVAEKMGLPSIGNEMAELYTNKYRMREFCIDNNLPTPEFKICYCLEEAIEFYETLNSKIIIKPLDSNSSRGVYSVNNIDELKEFFDKSISFSKIEKAVLCERYIEGVEFTVDGIMTPSGHVTLAISEKEHYEHNKNIACTLFFSHYNEKFNYDLLRSTNDNYVNKTGLPFGLTHAEYKYEDGKFYLIEIGARGGGNLIGSHLVPLMSGVDNYELLINMALGNEITEEVRINPKLIDRCAVLRFFDAPKKSGKLKGIKGIDYISSHPNVVEFAINCQLGEVVVDAIDDSARIGFYIAHAESKQELRKIMSDIESAIVFEVE